MKFGWTWTVPILVAACSGPARAITGAEVIERMEERFAKAKTYSATFEKKFFWSVLDRNMSREGRIFTRRPRQFRVEVEDGDLVIADGEAIWVYNKANQQVIVAPYEDELRTPWKSWWSVPMDTRPFLWPRPSWTEQTRTSSSCNLGRTHRPTCKSSVFASG